LSVLRVGYLRRHQSLPASLALSVSILDGPFFLPKNSRPRPVTSPSSAAHRRLAAIRHRRIRIYEELR
jgi:hypothetical protein